MREHSNDEDWRITRASVLCAVGVALYNVSAMLLDGVAEIIIGVIALIIAIAGLASGWGPWRRWRFRRRYTAEGHAERRQEAAVRAFKKRGGKFINRKTLVVDGKGVISAGFKPRPRWQVRLISCRKRLTYFGTLLYNKIVRG